MPHPIPPRLACSLVLAAALGAALAACSHTSEEDRLVGYWEGSLPLPTTGEAIPISYDFRPNDGLTVTVGLGPNRTVTEWQRWEVHSAEDDIVLHIHRGDGRVFSTLARHVQDDTLMLWDLGTEESTAAHVRRVVRPDASDGTGDGTGAGP